MTQDVTYTEEKSSFGDLVVGAVAMFEQNKGSGFGLMFVAGELFKRGQVELSDNEKRLFGILYACAATACALEWTGTAKSPDITEEQAAWARGCAQRTLERGQDMIEKLGL